MIDFEMEGEQKRILSAAREIGREVLYPAETALDRLVDPEAVAADEGFWRAMGDAFAFGLPKMALPESVGGMGLDPQTTGMVWEEIGRWSPGFAASLISGSIVPQLIAFLAPGNLELVERYVIPFCEDETGRRITAWCSSEPEIGSDGKNYYDPSIHHHTQARKNAGGYAISGTKSDFASNGGIADAYIVFACLRPELGIRGSGTFVVPADAGGVQKGRALDKIGLRVLNQAAVFFDDVEVPESHLLFPCGEDYPMLHNAIITVGNLAVGYVAVGIMRAAYECALAHAKGRVQGGQPIFSHQLVARRLFSCFRAIESARALLWRGSWLSAKSFPGDLKTSIAAKTYATDQAVLRTTEMIEILGGYGMSKEYPVEKCARDARLLTVMDGTNETLMLKAAAGL
jgi:alkylation response protein AidB-like acyl-CoA dehydrogenase